MKYGKTTIEFNFTLKSKSLNKFSRTPFYFLNLSSMAKLVLRLKHWILCCVNEKCLCNSCSCSADESTEKHLFIVASFSSSNSCACVPTTSELNWNWRITKFRQNFNSLFTRIFTTNTTMAFFHVLDHIRNTGIRVTSTVTNNRDAAQGTSFMWPQPSINARDMESMATLWQQSQIFFLLKLTEANKTLTFFNQNFVFSVSVNCDGVYGWLLKTLCGAEPQGVLSDNMFLFLVVRKGRISSNVK